MLISQHVRSDGVVEVREHANEDDEEGWPLGPLVERHGNVQTPWGFCTKRGGSVPGLKSKDSALRALIMATRGMNPCVE